MSEEIVIRRTTGCRTCGDSGFVVQVQTADEKAREIARAEIYPDLGLAKLSGRRFTKIRCPADKAIKSVD